VQQCKYERSWTRNNVTVIDCDVCGFIHQLPVPSAKSVDKLYRDIYYSEVKPEYLNIVKRDKEQFLLWASLKKNIAEEFLKTIPERMESPSVLDVGASFGQFLILFSKEGWRCVGVEPSLAASRIAGEVPGLSIHTDLLEKIPTEVLLPPFSLVHLGEVINHMRDPAAILKYIHDDLLAPGGIVIIETSNDFSEMQEAIVDCTDDEQWWITEDHICYFNGSSLARLLEHVGFQVVERLGTFPMELFPLMGDNYRQDEKIGRICHQKRIRFELNMEKAQKLKTLRSFYKSLGEAGFGRSVIMFAQKKKDSKL